VRLVGYIRVPLASRANRARQQEEALRAWAQAEGHQILYIARDEGTRNGDGLDHRTGLHEAIAAMLDRRAAGLVVDRLATIARLVAVQEAVLALVWRHGGEVFTCDAGRIRAEATADPTRRILRRMVRSLDQLDRGVSEVRRRAGRRRALARGRHPGGAPSFGYRAVARELRADPVEQAALARIAALRRDGASLREIARVLDAEGLRPKRSDRWHPESVRRILARLEGGDGPNRAG
jgi:DNA invertase Pin-like site-specific DNA recombinase